MTPSIAALFRTYRKRLGITQKELSTRMSFSHTVISRVETENSRYIPSEEYLRAACGALELSPEETDQIWQAYHLAVQENELHTFLSGQTGSPLESGETSSAEIKQAGARRFRNKWVRGSLPWLFLALALLGYFVIYISSKSGEIALPYYEDFERWKRSDWDFMNSGSWEIFELNDSKVFGVQNQDLDVIPNAYLLGSEEWTDYSVSVDFTFESGRYEQIYLVVRNAGRKNNCTGYRIGGNRQGLEIFRFVSRDGGCHGETLARTSKVRLVSHKTYGMRIDVEGEEIRLFIDGEPVLSANDSLYSKGGLGLLAYEVHYAGFDNLRVTPFTDD